MKELRRLLDNGKTRRAVRAVAHITGGGIPGNLPRCLPKGLGAVLDKSAWPRPVVFDLVREWGGVSEDEMYDVFNMGLGLIIVVDGRKEAECRRVLGGRGVYQVGEVVALPGKRGHKGPRRVSWV